MNTVFSNQNDLNGGDLAQLLDKTPSLKKLISSTKELLSVASYVTKEWPFSKTKSNHEDHDLIQKEQKNTIKRLKSLNEAIAKTRTEEESLHNKLAKLKEYGSAACSLNSKLKEDTIRNVVSKGNRAKEQQDKKN